MVTGNTLITAPPLCSSWCSCRATPLLLPLQKKRPRVHCGRTCIIACKPCGSQVSWPLQPRHMRGCIHYSFCPSPYHYYKIPLTADHSWPFGLALPFLTSPSSSPSSSVFPPNAASRKAAAVPNNIAIRIYYHNGVRSDAFNDTYLMTIPGCSTLCPLTKFIE